jgi:hypothetical protein
MAFDAQNQRLFVACRRPARLIEISTSDLKHDYPIVANVPCVDDSDDLFYDAKRNQVMVIGGGFRPDLQGKTTASVCSFPGEMGSVDVFSVGAEGQLTRVSGIPTSVHARTGTYSPLLDRLFVFASFVGKADARVLMMAPRD